MNGVSLQQLNAETENSTNKSNSPSTALYDLQAYSELNSRKIIQDLTNHIIELENLVISLNTKLENSLVPLQQKRFLTRQDVCELLNVSLPTLNAWEKANILIPDRIGTRVRYTLESINNAFRK